MITREKAEQFANDWVSAWNSHDIDKIIGHYDKDIVLTSPIASKLLGGPKVTGIEAVRGYFLKGLDAYPNLHFEILDVLCGEESIILYYKNQNGIMAGEFMRLNDEYKIVEMYAHYSQ